MSLCQQVATADGARQNQCTSAGDHCSLRQFPDMLPRKHDLLLATATQEDDSPQK
jgi:3-deoxy-D-manno-octulosonic acid (KDO) 8-phosphate synthase